jgi:hypothetical protein
MDENCNDRANAVRRAGAVRLFGRRSITTSVSKKRCHESPLPASCRRWWLVYTKGANDMPGKHSTKMKGVNAGPQTIDCDDFRRDGLELRARWLLTASLICTVSGHRTTHGTIVERVAVRRRRLVSRAMLSDRPTLGRARRSVDIVPTRAVWRRATLLTRRPPYLPVGRSGRAGAGQLAWPDCGRMGSSSMPSAEALQLMLDKIALHELVQDYWRAVDRRDYALLESI